MRSTAEGARGRAERTPALPTGQQATDQQIRASEASRRSEVQGKPGSIKPALGQQAAPSVSGQMKPLGAVIDAAGDNSGIDSLQSSEQQ